MVNRVRSARSALEGAARSFDACSGPEAVALLEELGAVRRLVDGLIARVAKRVENTAAHTYGTDRSAAELCERLVGISSREAKRAIAVAAGSTHSRQRTSRCARVDCRRARRT